MKNREREQVWQARVAQWQASGLSQQAYAVEQGFPVHQVGYWVWRLPAVQAAPALLPVRVAPVAAAAPAISLRSDRGWTLTLPGDVPAGWLGELMRPL